MTFHYQSLAEPIKDKIVQGELNAGQKLISLRQFAKLNNISLNTATRCYELLEAQGFVSAKNKSGYFVNLLKKNQHDSDLPQHPDFNAQPREISNLELQMEIQQASINSRLIHLGSVQISPNHVPVYAIRKSIQRALKNSKPEDFLYSDKQGHLHLRQALSDHWAEDGFYLSPEDIYISNGCMPALSVIVQSLTEEGDSVIVPTPNFNGQLQLLGSLKRKIVEIPADTQGIDLDSLERAMQQPETKACLITANFQNPLGFCLSHAEKEKIAQLAAKYQCYVIEDDIYAECSFSLQRPLPIKHWDQEGYVIFCGSVSKSLSSAYRVGWFCIPKSLQALKAQLISKNVSVNTPLQLGLADLIYSRAYRNHLLKLKPKLSLQVEQYRTYLFKAFEGIKIGLSQPQGGYALWMQMPDHIDGLALYYYAKQQGINIVPGEVFGEESRYKNCIRLNAGHELSEELKKAIHVLADWVRAQCNG